jgi:amidase
MDRRDFIKTATIAAGASAMPSCARSAPAQSSAAASTTPPAFEFDETTIAQIQQKMRDGSLTSRALVDAYLRRIDDLDRKGPALHAILEINPDAQATAARLDDERKAGRIRGPLHGVPVVIKGNIDTHDRMSTTAGSTALKGVVAPRDAFLVERLRNAGAVLLAKSNLSEWANFRSPKSSSGWSALGGQGRNPYGLNRTPCGSSSGSAQATAANLTALSIGTETDGSIVCPASLQSVVGIKPTVGLVSRRGIIPISHTQDTAGPIARTVADAAVLLAAIAAPDPEDKATAANNARPIPDYASALDANGLRGARIGAARAKVTGYHAETDTLYDEALAAMKAHGAEIIDPADIPHFGDYDETELTVMLYEFKADLDAYLASAGAPVKTLQELIAFNDDHRAEEMPYFGQELFLRAQQKGPLTDNAYVDALARNRRLSGSDGIDAVMDRLKLDAIVAPTAGPPWVIDPVYGDRFAGGSSTPAAVAGYPSITVPMGFCTGLPVGLSFIGRAWSELALISLAYAFEQATRHRQPPRFPAIV